MTRTTGKTTQEVRFIRKSYGPGTLVEIIGIGRRHDGSPDGTTLVRFPGGEETCLRTEITSDDDEPSSGSSSPHSNLLLVTTAHPSLYDHMLDGKLHPNLGRLIQPRHTSSIEKTAEAGIPWAADNDCFQGLNEPKFVAMIDRLAGLDGCLFVTVPDVVGDADATLELFDRWIGELDSRGLPAALVAQDGLELRLDDIPWDRIVAIFIGGSTEWKEGPEAAKIARMARDRGKWVHWGRINTRRRYKLITANGGAVDSWDGSKWARFRKTYLDIGLSWARGGAGEPMPV